MSVRAKNEIQVPKQAITKHRPHPDLTFSSEIANNIRYTSPETYALSEELKEHEQALSESYEPFLQGIVA